METATVNPPLSQELLGSELVEYLPDTADECWIPIEDARERWCWIHSKINVGHGRAGIIEDEPEWTSSLGVSPPEISANNRRRWSIFLRVPRRAVAAKIALVQSALLAVRQVFPQRWETVLNFVLGQARIQQKQPPVDLWKPAFVCFDFIVGQVTRTREYRAKNLHREPVRLDVLFRQNKIRVVPRRDAALDPEKIR